MQEKRGLVQQSLWRLNVFEHDALGHRLELHLLIGGQLFAREDNNRNFRQRRFGVHFFKQLEARHIG